MQEDDSTFLINPFELAQRLIDEAALADSGGPVRPSPFGPYEFPDAEPLGQGAMGDVWLANETDANRRVAIKFLRRAADPDVWLSREIQRLGALEHQFIARLYHHGVLADGTPWLAMEFVDGKHLDQYCREKNCSLSERLALFRAVCVGVQYAHDRGIIHGDLKPSNILISSAGQPKLLDFGLAERFLGADGRETQSPRALGFTPAYASPQQLRREQVGTFNDVYALGVVLYELLTGELPFGDLEEGPRAFEPPSRKRQSLLSVSDSDWHDLDAICFKALEEDLGRRYTSVEAMAADLDRFSENRAVLARAPHPLSYLFSKFLKRNRGRVIAAAALVLAAAGAGTAYTVQLARARNAAESEAARTQKVKQFFLDTFNDAAEDALPAEKARIVSLFLDRGARDAGLLEKDPAMQADLYVGFGEMYEEWGSYEAAERLVREAISIAKDRTQELKARIALGNILVDRGKYAEAIALGENLLKEKPGRSEYPACLTMLANAHFQLGEYAVADSLHQQSLAADQKLYGDRHPEVAQDLMNLGNIETNRGRYSEAEKYFRRALSIHQSCFGKDSPQAADSAAYIAQALDFQGGHEAEEANLLAGALAALQAKRLTADKRVAFTYAQMGALGLKQNHLDEARDGYQKAEDVYRALRGDQHYMVALEMANVASVYLRQRDYPHAEELFREVLRRYAKSLPADNQNVAIVRIKLGHCLLGEKRYQDAEVELLAGSEILKKQLSPSASWLVTTRKDLLAIYTALNDTQKAARIRAEDAK
jgi:serine/threonine-protein kinase